MISFSYLSFVRERYTLPNSMQRIGPANKSSAHNEQAANVLGETRQRQSCRLSTPGGHADGVLTDLKTGFLHGPKFLSSLAVRLLRFGISSNVMTY
jgi:hypothetical protein